MIGTKFAWSTPRSVPFSNEEKDAARDALNKFNEFLKRLWAAHQHSERVMDILNKSPETSPDTLFSIRHLIRRFRDEVRQHYAIIPAALSASLIGLEPFMKDTDTNSIYRTIEDTWNELSQAVETYMETFEDFSAPDQIQRLKTLFQKITQLGDSVKGIIEGRLHDHFEKNILQRQTLSELQFGIRRRARLITMLGE